MKQAEQMDARSKRRVRCEAFAVWMTNKAFERKPLVFWMIDIPGFQWFVTCGLGCLKRFWGAPKSRGAFVTPGYFFGGLSKLNGLLQDMAMAEMGWGSFFLLVLKGGFWSGWDGMGWLWYRQSFGWFGVGLVVAGSEVVFFLRVLGGLSGWHEMRRVLFGCFVGVRRGKKQLVIAGYYICKMFFCWNGKSEWCWRQKAQTYFHGLVKQSFLK